MASTPRALITGGAGFLGSHLADRLLGEGYAVHAVDDLSTGCMANLSHLRRDPRFSFLEYDVSLGLRDVGKMDLVFHLASPASPADFQRKQLQILAANADGTRHALELARRYNARFILASTSEVYGDPTQHPQRESYAGNVALDTIRGCYDEAKRFAEVATHTWRRAHQVNTGIARIFNTYGPRMRWDDGRVIPTFIHQAVHGEPLTIIGDGEQTRAFCFVDDLIDGLFRLSQVDHHDAINLGNPEEVSINTLADEILALASRPSSARVYLEPRSEEPRIRCPDIGAAQRILNWQPQTSRRIGLAMCLRHAQNPGQNSVSPAELLT